MEDDHLRNTIAMLESKGVKSVEIANHTRKIHRYGHMDLSDDQVIATVEARMSTLGPRSVAKYHELVNELVRRERSKELISVCGPDGPVV